MEARAFWFAFIPVIVGVLAAAPTAQDRVALPASGTPPTALAGKWVIDDAAVREDSRNWRRPVGAAPFVGPTAAAGTAGGGQPAAVGPGPGGTFGAPGRPRPAGSLGEPYDSDVRRALRDLLEVTRRFDIAVMPAQVTFTDDLARVFTFSTDGRREKHRAGGTEYDVRTTWDGDVLLQEISAYREFKMSQAFRLSEDRTQLFVWLNVDKPALVPPVRQVRRVYARLQ